MYGVLKHYEDGYLNSKREFKSKENNSRNKYDNTNPDTAQVNANSIFVQENAKSNMTRTNIGSIGYL